MDFGKVTCIDKWPFISQTKLKINLKNQIQLTSYIDRFGGGDISSFHSFLSEKLKSYLGGGIHLLPFFSFIDGSDAGYDPINHQLVDSRLGNWDDIQQLSKDFDLIADLIVNHVSDKSEEFLDVQKKGEDSEFFDLFLTKDKVFKDGATEEEIARIYRPRPHRPFSLRTLDNGKKYEFWTTFSRNQIDIDVKADAGDSYIKAILGKFADSGIKMIRLDAVGYAIKKAGSSCFLIPETLEYISELTEKVNSFGMKSLAEIHGHFESQIEIAKRVDYVYDFALPPLILYTLYSKNSTRLKQWLAISPKNCITVLDTHDGIGVIDVAGADSKPGILSDSEVDELVENIHSNSNNTSKKATGTAASNLDLYQVNTTFYEALGKNDQLYLIARAIQFFCPGIPQIYYAGLLAAENDMELLEKTKVGRDINRPYYQFEEIEKELQKDVVQSLLSLMKFRNTHPAFQGRMETFETADGHLHMRWEKAEFWAELEIDLEINEMKIAYNDSDQAYKIFN